MSEQLFTKVAGGVNPTEITATDIARIYEELEALKVKADELKARFSAGTVEWCACETIDTHVFNILHIVEDSE